MTFGQVATAAIGLAGNGFPMFRYLAGRFKTAFDQYNAHPSTAEIYLPGGRAPKQGEMFYQKDLAATLSKIADVEASSAGKAGRPRSRRPETTFTPANWATKLPHSTRRWEVSSPRKTWPGIMSRWVRP